MSDFTVYCGAEVDRPIVTHEMFELLRSTIKAAGDAVTDAVYSMQADATLRRVGRLGEMVANAPHATFSCDYEGTEDSVDAALDTDRRHGSDRIRVTWTCPWCGTHHVHGRDDDAMEAIR